MCLLPRSTAGARSRSSHTGARLNSRCRCSGRPRWRPECRPAHAHRDMCRAWSGSRPRPGCGPERRTSETARRSRRGHPRYRLDCCTHARTARRYVASRSASRPRSQRSELSWPPRSCSRLSASGARNHRIRPKPSVPQGPPRYAQSRGRVSPPWSPKSPRAERRVRSPSASRRRRFVYSGGSGVGVRPGRQPGPSSSSAQS